jgi:CDGSH-type Zn-finger protein
MSGRRDRSEIRIVVSRDGPYLVYGTVPLGIDAIATNEDGGMWEWRTVRELDAPATYALCRCGRSQSKPFCDGTHAKVHFDGTETATRATHDEQAEIQDGPALQLRDAQPLCAFARFCDSYGTIWARVEEGDPRSAEIVRHEGEHCPSGRLVLVDRATAARLEPQFPPSIRLIEDPEKACSGPLFVRGGIHVESHDGTPYEMRNRVTLCRCGASENKPFCDGMHADVAFSDGLDPQEVP